MDYYFEGRIDTFLIDHIFFVSYIQMLSDGRIVSSGGFQFTDEQLGGGIRGRIYDKNIIIWDRSGNVLLTISTPVRSMIIMKNDNIAITDDINNLKIFNPNTGEKIYELSLNSENDKMNNYKLLTEISNNKIIYGRESLSNRFFIYIINIEDQSRPLPLYWTNNSPFLINRDNIKNSILELSNGNFILQINSQELYVYYPEENISEFKIEIKTDDIGLFTSISETQIIYVDKDKIILINLIDGTLTISIYFDDSLYPTDIFNLSNSQIFILRDNEKYYILYCYDVKNNAIIEYINFPKYTEIIGILPDNNQLVLYKDNELMIFDIQMSQITKTIVLENRDSEYFTSDIKILRSGKITYGLKNGDIGIII